jgi:hypothetical protein
LIILQHDIDLSYVVLEEVNTCELESTGECIILTEGYEMNT